MITEKAQRVHCGYHDVPGPCDFCGRDEVCATIAVDVFDGGRGWRPGAKRPACYTCWHSEREKTQAYHVFRVDTPEHVAKYGEWAPGIPGTLEEAAEFLVEMMLRDGVDGRSRYTIKPCDWFGERRSHPGYMARRRAAVVAEHPEYK